MAKKREAEGAEKIKPMALTAEVLVSPEMVAADPILQMFLADREVPETRPHVWTMEELLAEYFPETKRVSGGVAAGLQRELRRRNRRAERGY